MAKIYSFEQGKEYVGCVIKVTEPTDPILGGKNTRICRIVFQVYLASLPSIVTHKGYATALLIFRKGSPICKAMGGNRVCSKPQGLLRGLWYKFVFGERINSQRQQITKIKKLKLPQGCRINPLPEIIMKISDLSSLLEISPTKARKIFDKVNSLDPESTDFIGKRRDRRALFPRFARILIKVDPELAGLVPAHLRP